MGRSFVTHERLTREGSGRTSSDRAFGIVFAAVFGVVGLLPVLRGGPVRSWALALAGVLLVVALRRPALLAPFNRWWTAFGLLLHRVVSPLVMGLIFYGVVTPTGVLLRLGGKDPLNLAWDRNIDTYWIDRRPPGPTPDTMPRQF
jgi:hypothetical protein